MIWNRIRSKCVKCLQVICSRFWGQNTWTNAWFIVYKSAGRSVGLYDRRSNYSSWRGSCCSHLHAGLAPPYLTADCSCRLVSLTDRHLRSADTRTCVVPPNKHSVRGQKFLKLWSKKCGTVCRLHSDRQLSFAVFKRHLKSYLFYAIWNRGA